MRKMNWITLSVLVVMLLALLMGGVGLVSAQDEKPVGTVEVTLDEPVPVGTVDLEQLAVWALVYLGHVLLLASVIQTAVNQLKPVFFDPIRSRFGDDVYLMVIYVARTALTALAYFYAWGGTAPIRAIIPIPVEIPDLTVAWVTIGLIVLGEEFIHPIIDRLYILRDIAKMLKRGAPETSINATVK